MNVKEIVAGWLKEHGYSGLGNFEADECGCEIDDLFPCSHESQIILDCTPGYKVSYTYEGHSGWHIQVKKPDTLAGKE